MGFGAINITFTLTETGRPVTKRFPRSSSFLQLFTAVVMLLFSISCMQVSTAEKASQQKDRAYKPRKISFPHTASDSMKAGIVRSVVCPVCGNSKLDEEELCPACVDELENTCYRCGAHEASLNGKLCSKCSRTICAICNRRKESRYDDLCVKCHNAIEVKSRR